MNEAKKPSKPKKFPAQERSRFTVDSILEAATYILVHESWENFTTNKVASKAGVNIASLYQYFPNKETILAELFRQHSEVRKAKNQAYDALDLNQYSLHELLTLIVQDCIDDHKAEPKLDRILREKVPKSVWWVDPDGDQKIEDLFERLILKKATNLPNKKFAGFFLRAGLSALLHETVDKHPEYFDDPHYASELTRFLEAYLHG